MFLSRIPAQSAIINVMAAAAQKAARGLIRDFGELEHLQISRKSLGDFVSTADHRSEKTIIQELKKTRPDYPFLTEESGVIEGADKQHRWIIDPLDGTTNFLHGVPHFCISIGLERDKEMVAGLIYDPVKDEMFWAEKGKGAFLNQRRLRVSGRRNLDESLIATGAPFGSHGDKAAFLKMIDAIMPLTAGLRRFGAAALDLAYVAAGRYDGYFENNISPWDIAAGMLIVKEAGGSVSEIGGGSNMLESGSILASNEHLYTSLAKLLNKKK